MPIQNQLDPRLSNEEIDVVESIHSQILET
jgi:hypothetical protein